MKESIGYTVTLNIMIVFITIIVAFLCAALIYFKSNKVSNIITSGIEKYEEYGGCPVECLNLEHGFTDQKGDIVTEYGEKLLSSKSKYLSTRMEANALRTGRYTFDIKVFKNGILSTGDTRVSEGYSYDWTINIDREKIDLVHWNNGLWDVLRVNGDEPLTPIDIYEKMIVRVADNIKKLFPNAKIVFALSTAVIEEWARPDFLRYNSDIEKYNEVAKNALSKKGIIINDLYSITKGFDSSLHAD
jgi:hypothetical protein